MKSEAPFKNLVASAVKIHYAHSGSDVFWRFAGEFGYHTESNPSLNFSLADLLVAKFLVAFITFTTTFSMVAIN